MITDKFGSLIEELGKVLKINLKTDKNNACLIDFKNGLKVQIEIDARGENVLIAADLGEIVQGRFRENVFREALKANGLPPPRNGIFAHSKKNESLVLYDNVTMEEISGEKLADFLLDFNKKAELWKGCIARNEVPSFTESEASPGKRTQTGGLFGLMQW